MAKAQDGTITLEVWKRSFETRKRTLWRERTTDCRKTAKR